MFYKFNGLKLNVILLAGLVNAPAFGATLSCQWETFPRDLDSVGSWDLQLVEEDAGYHLTVERTGSDDNQTKLVYDFAALDCETSSEVGRVIVCRNDEGLVLAVQAVENITRVLIPRWGSPYYRGQFAQDFYTRETEDPKNKTCYSKTK